ncbi:phosphotransferase family enzyme [Fontibacillus phaseoli]|uniref:Phosphotransferase family enzyme n=1 Tax=Fontibacillus phaseoli TaxID=1416533 RepID=A0A369BT56_9BACL|nr:aminoglycoside phosphotransferase family protein [Fontibacillus phaseoli]RCX23868.1 phosphotransferase family enzyme [Fontibacillus phaseoli]
MLNPITQVYWVERKFDPLLESSDDDSIRISSLDSGLEAEVTRISTDHQSYVLKVWNRDSRPDIGYQYRLLDTLNNRGFSVSKPYGWGYDQDKNQVLLTSFDGSPIGKINQKILKTLAKMLINIHSIPLEDLDRWQLHKYDFMTYFYPTAEDHPDIKALLVQLLQSTDLKQDRIIHGDYNLGNILEAEGKYTIIDWSNIQLGDPRYDMAWSTILMRIYVGERYGSHFLSAFLSDSPYSIEEMELFEAIACLRWLLLNRIAPDLPKTKDTLSRVKMILKNNPHLSEEFL